MIFKDYSVSLQSIRGCIHKYKQMNKSRRKDLEQVLKVITSLNEMQLTPDTLQALRNAAKTLEEVTDDEQMALDNLPENLMWSARADMFNDNLDNLLDAQADLELVVEAYAKAVNTFESVKGEVASVIRNCTEAIERR